jgi:hypothetical protein
MYKAQYDPNNDFQIFSAQGATGGLMNVQEKMNLADNVQAESSSEEEDEDEVPAFPVDDEKDRKTPADNNVLPED